MCDFKPGDEVVCIARLERVRAPFWKFWTRYDRYPVPFGQAPLVVTAVTFGTSDSMPELGEIAWIKVQGNANWLQADRFRKVQRRDLSAWLKTSVVNTDRLDKRQKAGVRA